MSTYVFKENAASKVQCTTDDNNMDSIYIDVEWTIQSQGGADEENVVQTMTGEEEEGDEE